MKRSWALAALAVLSIGAPPPLPTSVVILAFSSKEANEVTAVENNLETIGIPFETTRDVERIAQAPVVILAGTITNTVLSPAQREKLYRFVEAGGTLVATHVQGNQYFPLFGIAEFAIKSTNFGLRFVDSSQDSSLRYLNRPEEREIHFGDPKGPHELGWTTEYGLSSGTALARFQNGSPALIRNYYGRGAAYCLGVSFADATLRWELGQSSDSEERWVNLFAPSADVFRLILRGLYEASVHPFVLIHTIPDGRESALILSHDVDARESFKNSVVFATLEQKYRTASTFFVTTKYFTDSTDTDYYVSGNIAPLRQLLAMGFDIGSHSVSHLATFFQFPLGDPAVTFKSYQPRSAPTVFGEVKVSKELLDRDISGQHTISFRAGGLSHPRRLIGALEDSGYQIDSTRAAGATLTNFPYRPLREVQLGAERSGMIEIPVTLDDSRGYLTPATLDRVSASWAGIVAANSENNAVTCLLIHPTDTTYKLEAEDRLLRYCRARPIWIGDVTRFGLFAKARAAVRVTSNRVGGELILRLNRERAALPSGLTLAVEAEPSVSRVSVQDSQSSDVPYQAIDHGDRKFLVLRP